MRARDFLHRIETNARPLCVSDEDIIRYDDRRVDGRVSAGLSLYGSELSALQGRAGSVRDHGVTAYVALDWHCIFFFKRGALLVKGSHRSLRN